MSFQEIVTKEYRPIVLMIMDGWGINASLEGNAIAGAKIPNVNFLKGNYPCIALQASGISVGLSWGEPGNSEVGHMTIGSGMILYQNLPRINLSIQNGTFFSNPAYLKAMDHVKQKGSALHLMGLVSNGGVHSHVDHLFALIEMAISQGVSKIFIHAFTDGRDTSPNSAEGFVEMLQEKLKEMGKGQIASIGGRYYGMDRNKSFDRIEKAYKSMIGTSEKKATDPLAVIKESYNQNVTDEFIEPTVLVDEKGEPVGPVRAGDAIIFFNFREDRARQIAKAFTQEDFSDFPRGEKIKDLLFISTVDYDESLGLEVAFPPQRVVNPLSKVISDTGKTQFHIAETEKYAHVTYFFNGGREEAFPGEERVLVPSPQVSSYESVPEMSAAEVTEKVLAAISSQKYDFILINYANADMLGHTGNFEVTVKAVEAVDKCVGFVTKAVLNQGGALLITADHGNAEVMMDPKTGEKITEHSANPVPCFFVTPDNKKERTENQILRHQSMVDGMLVDLAPTILSLMNIPVPKDIVGNSLLDALR